MQIPHDQRRWTSEMEMSEMDLRLTSQSAEVPVSELSHPLLPSRLFFNSSDGIGRKGERKGERKAACYKVS